MKYILCRVSIGSNDTQVFVWNYLLSSFLFSLERRECQNHKLKIVELIWHVKNFHHLIFCLKKKLRTVAWKYFIYFCYILRFTSTCEMSECEYIICIFNREYAKARYDHQDIFWLNRNRNSVINNYTKRTNHVIMISSCKHVENNYL